MNDPELFVRSAAVAALYVKNQHLIAEVAKKVSDPEVCRAAIGKLTDHVSSLN